MQTVVRVGRSADRGDWTTCRACFTDEVFLDHDGSNHAPSVRKMDHVIDEWRNLFVAYSASLHFVSSFEIEIKGGKADCNSLVQAVHTQASASGSVRVLQSFGLYQDILVLDNMTWKISSRHYRQTIKINV